jgi:hypothetical protein
VSAETALRIIEFMFGGHVRRRAQRPPWPNSHSTRNIIRISEKKSS